MPSFQSRATSSMFSNKQFWIAGSNRSNLETAAHETLQIPWHESSEYNEKSLEC